MTLPRAILEGAAYLVDIGGTLSRRGARNLDEGVARAFRDAWSVLDDELNAAIEAELRSTTQPATSPSTTTKGRTGRARNEARETPST